MWPAKIFVMACQMIGNKCYSQNGVVFRPIVRGIILCVFVQFVLTVFSKTPNLNNEIAHSYETRAYFCVMSLVCCRIL